MPSSSAHRADDVLAAVSGATRARSARRIGYAAALLPASFVTAAAVAAGRTDRARAWWARACEQDLTARTATRRPGAARLLAHALMCVPLGFLALIPVGVELLFVLRGVLYPLVVQGPYDHAWGGPSLGGAWLAHFGLSLPLAFAGLGLLWLLGRLHLRLAGGMWGREVGLWPFLVLAVASLGGIALVIAWSHQI
ncbi:hypothetical protein AB0J21_07405 [Streptomyces sp. NPDC049954]|uniref:hypothetical protein n=1 Tax=Streptomyces sp. NPDC049954 TaxID=3155779 RepID=UPI00342EF049